MYTICTVCILCTRLCVLYTYNYGLFQTFSSIVCLWLRTEVMLAACVDNLVQQKVLLLRCTVHTPETTSRLSHVVCVCVCVCVCQPLSASLASHFHYNTLTAHNLYLPPCLPPLCLPGEVDPLWQKQVSLAHSPSSHPLHPPAPPPTHMKRYENSTFLQSGCQKAYELFVGHPSCQSAHTNEHPVTTEALSLLHEMTSKHNSICEQVGNTCLKSSTHFIPFQ